MVFIILEKANVMRWNNDPPPPPAGNIDFWNRILVLNDILKTYMTNLFGNAYVLLESVLTGLELNATDI